MNYKLVYDNIIYNNQIKKCTSPYKERHHILPKCLGGSNEKSNLVYLSYREHFLCHWLLIKIYPDNFKLKAAFAKMIGKSSKNKIISGWMFDTVKRNLKNTHYPWLRNRTPWNKGLKGKSPQIPWNKGKKLIISEEDKLKKAEFLREYLKNNTHPRKGKAPWNKGLVGKSPQIPWNKGKKMPAFKCDFCLKETSLVNIKRWHNSNCKFKPQHQID